MEPTIRRAVLFSGVVTAIVVGGFFFIVTFREEILAVFLHTGETVISFWLQDQRGPQVVLKVEPDGGDLQRTVEESIRVLERRLDELAVRASVRHQGPAQIVVRLPHSANPPLLIEMVTRRGRLEFRLIDASMTAAEAISGRPPRGSEVLYDANKTPFLVEKKVQLSGGDLVDAESGFRSNVPLVTVRFASDKFGEVTAANVGRSLATVFDGEVLAALIIREPIPARIVEIERNSKAFTVEQSIELATLLRAGELPGRLVVVEERAPEPQRP